MKAKDKRVFEKAIKDVVDGYITHSCIALNFHGSELTEEYNILFKDCDNPWWLDRQAHELDFEERKFLRVMLLTMAQEVL